MEQKITDCLGLSFINEKEFRGNVCFANSPEVHSEFRETFTSKDLVNYYYAVLVSTKHRETIQDFSKIDLADFLIPTNKEKFWKLIQLGNELRRVDLFENKIIILTETVRISKKIDTIEIL